MADRGDRLHVALTIMLDVLWGLVGFVVSLAVGIAYLRCC